MNLGFIEYSLSRTHASPLSALLFCFCSPLPPLPKRFAPARVKAKKAELAEPLPLALALIRTNLEHRVYEDPKQVRAEWEGWVAVVDKEKSVRIQKFVAQAPELIKILPWPQEFEKDKFLKPGNASAQQLGPGF